MFKSGRGPGQPAAQSANGDSSKALTHKIQDDRLLSSWEARAAALLAGVAQMSRQTSCLKSRTSCRGSVSNHKQPCMSCTAALQHAPCMQLSHRKLDTPWISPASILHAGLAAKLAAACRTHHGDLNAAWAPMLHCLLEHTAAWRTCPRELDATWGVLRDCPALQNILAAFRTRHGDLDAAWEAVRHARRPRVHTFIATSPIHMQYKLKMTPDQVGDGAEHRTGLQWPRPACAVGTGQAAVPQCRISLICCPYRGWPAHHEVATLNAAA